MDVKEPRSERGPFATQLVGLLNRAALAQRTPISRRLQAPKSNGDRMKRPWMKFFPDDYLRDTKTLTPIQHGAYLLLILDYWQHGFLPDDDAKLAAIARMTKKEWNQHRLVLKEFFLPGWRHKRIDEEISRADAAYKRRAESGQKGGLRKASVAVALLEQNDSNAAVRASGSGSILLYDLGSQETSQREDIYQDSALRSARAEAEPLAANVTPLRAPR